MRIPYNLGLPVEMSGGGGIRFAGAVVAPRVAAGTLGTVWAGVAPCNGGSAGAVPAGAVPAAVLLLGTLSVVGV